MTTGKVLISIMAGIATGAALGVLFAPDKGSSTRRKIVQKRDAYVDGLSEKVNEFVDSVTKKVESVKKQAAHLVERGNGKLSELETELIAATNAKMR